MKTSETITKLATDLAKAHHQLKNAVKSAENPHFKSKYADLAAIRDATAPILANHNMAIIQATEFTDDGRLALVTRLQHASGEYIESTFPVPFMPDKPQVMGSAITYARRYSWSAICGIAAGLDDDGEAARVASEHGPASPPADKIRYGGGTGNKDTMNDLAKGHDGPSAYVSRPVWDVIHPQIAGLKFEAMDQWWDKVASPAKLAHSWKRRLFIEFMMSAISKAPNASSLTEFYNGFSSILEDIRNVSPEHANDLDDAYTAALDNFSPLNAG